MKHVTTQYLWKYFDGKSGYFKIHSTITVCWLKSTYVGVSYVWCTGLHVFSSVTTKFRRLRWRKESDCQSTHTVTLSRFLIQRFSRAGPRGRGRKWATLGVHPLSWLPSNNRLEEVCGTLTKGTFSSPLLLSNQNKGCTPSVAHSLSLPLPPGYCSTCLLC